jgi:acyl-CoA synthetase (NDP forming)
LAGDYLVMRTQVKRQGVVVAENLEEFADVLELTLRCGATPSRGTPVLTESGAFKALTLDLCEQLGLSLPILTNERARQLRAALPNFVLVSNPVDLTALDAARSFISRGAFGQDARRSPAGCDRTGHTGCAQSTIERLPT